MKSRLPFAPTLVTLAANVARKTFERRGVCLVTKFNRQYVARTLRGEALPLRRNARSYPGGAL